MSTLLEDINQGSEWIVKAFAELNKSLDYSLDSLQEIDKFFDEEAENGQPKSGGVLEQGLGSKLFSIGAYVGQTLIKNCPGSEWEINDIETQGEINMQVKFKSGRLLFQSFVICRL
ncbi:MAG: hypothetical protein UW75_C0047G0004 [Parcubacteria group bacterium GW2011_GWF2_44_8]|nr:MAG: hypothetical protein UW75_C0047G0004 [Parcubacteria group bacterium GW2011_GWF2_44_8]